MRWPGFVGPSYTSQSKIAAYDRTVNWYCERTESGTAEASYVMYPTPGYETLSTMPTSPGRAIFTLNGTAYAIGGPALYDVTGSEPVLRAQGLSDLSGDVAQILGNGDAGHQLLIRADRTLYALDLNAVPGTQPLDPPSSALLGNSSSGPRLSSLFGIGAGNLDFPFYGYGVTYVTGSGETTVGVQRTAASSGNGPPGFRTIDLSTIPTGPPGVTSRIIYRTVVQATFGDAETAQLKLLTTIADNTTTVYHDTSADASLGVNAPTVNTAGIDPPFSGLSASYYGYAFTFVTADGETTPSPRVVSQNEGGQSIFGGAEIFQNSVSVGPSVVTSRNIYRTAAQASGALASAAQLKFLDTIADNITTFYSDAAPDWDLGANAPTVNTATVTIDNLTTIEFPCDQIAYLDGYGILLDAQRSEIRVSGLFDFATWDAIDVAQRSDAADRWRAMLVAHKEIWLFGSETTSVYFNSFGPGSAATDFPFSPIPSVFVQEGIMAPLSACVVDGQPMWIGEGINGTGIVRRANGYTPERVSTHAVENSFRLIGADLALAEGSTYQENGHVFYVLTIPGLTTWVYDATEGLWHERGNENGLEFVGLGTRGNAQIEGVQFTLSLTTGAVYHQSIAFHVGTDGVGLVRLRRAPHICTENKGEIIDRIELKFEPGLALATGPGSDPHFALRQSTNGGQSWGNTRTTSAGVSGDYDVRATWTGLGYGRDRLIEIRVSDPIFWPIIDCFLDIRVGAS